MLFTTSSFMSLLDSNSLATVSATVS
jgi:hypothetical protein